MAAALAIIATLSASSSFAEPRAFSADDAIFFQLAVGRSWPTGRVDGLPGGLDIADARAELVYRSGWAFGAALGLHGRHWLGELSLEGKYGGLTSAGQALATHVGPDPTSQFFALEFAISRRIRVTDHTSVFAGIGNGLLTYSLVDGIADTQHDTGYSLVLRAGVSWMRPGYAGGLFVRPTIRYQVGAWGTPAPRDLLLLIGFGGYWSLPAQQGARSARG